MISLRRLRRCIEDFHPGSDRTAVRSRRRTLRLLEQGRAALDRRNYEPGHVTASGIVFSPDRAAMLLVYHRRLERWLQPGGHIDLDDDSVMEAAAREVLEETGVELEDQDHDLVWRFMAAGAPPRRTRERRQAVWCPVDDLDHHGVDQPLLRTVRRALRRR